MWTVRSALPDDVGEIVHLAQPYRDFISPYVLNGKQVRAYLDEWLVAEEGPTIGGAMHYVTLSGDRNFAYLLHLKQVNRQLLSTIFDAPGIMLSQPTCPGKGSLRALVDYLKRCSPMLYCWLSVVSPVLEYYQDRLGFLFTGEYRFMNVYKGDYSVFRLGTWKGRSE